MGQLKLKDLYIGKTDGYNEFLEYGSDVCRNLFFEYPNLDILSFRWLSIIRFQS